LAELAVLVGVEFLEARLLARAPFGLVDPAVLVGVVAHHAARRRRRLGVGIGGEGGTGEQEKRSNRDDLDQGHISYKLYK
jgi:hypothetical protein